MHILQKSISFWKISWFKSILSVDLNQPTEFQIVGINIPISVELIKFITSPFYLINLTLIKKIWKKKLTARVLLLVRSKTARINQMAKVRIRTYGLGGGGGIFWYNVYIEPFLFSRFVYFIIKMCNNCNDNQTIPNNWKYQ